MPLLHWQLYFWHLRNHIEFLVIMEPAIRDGRLYFLNRVSPYIRQYRIGDIIAFKHEERLWISRIVALEASTIQIIEGSVIVDGTVLESKGIHRNWSGWKYGVYAIDTPFQW